MLTNVYNSNRRALKKPITVSAFHQPNPFFTDVCRASMRSLQFTPSDRHSMLDIVVREPERPEDAPGA